MQQHTLVPEAVYTAFELQQPGVDHVFIERRGLQTAHPKQLQFARRANLHADVKHLILALHLEQSIDQQIIHHRRPLKRHRTVSEVGQRRHRVPVKIASQRHRLRPHKVQGAATLHRRTGTQLQLPGTRLTIDDQRGGRRNIQRPGGTVHRHPVIQQRQRVVNINQPVIQNVSCYRPAVKVALRQDRATCLIVQQRATTELQQHTLITEAIDPAIQPDHTRVVDVPVERRHLPHIEASQLQFTTRRRLHHRVEHIITAVHGQHRAVDDQPARTDEGDGASGRVRRHRRRIKGEVALQVHALGPAEAQRAPRSLDGST